MNYIKLLSNHPFMKITIANAIGRFGDSLDMLLFSWLIYDITKEASWSAMMVACNIVPSIVLQPIAGVLIEHKEKLCIFVIYAVHFVLLYSLFFFFIRCYIPMYSF